MPITIERFDANQLQSHLPEFIDLLCDTVNNGASVNFLAPLSVEESEAFWQRIAADLPGGTRIVLAALENDRVVGSVQLALATQPNGPHRAEVQKLFVHSHNRRQGIARLLMLAIEEQAKTHHRTLLVLDTERGSGAETFYEQMGYQRAGSIPGFALSTAGVPNDNVIFYKNIG
jgi:GNAT superfamily N-acetyltransferase